ncbi:unnamed protein product [Protopolystoma xenopodis]|uniref:Uncharacterized protein n=1 Tax=Protopolystoma xenopodis TaxID=117903 RepID=A0A3S5ADU6_9PLAT|nr:unnamed protein product [Protopolystoma xenopodis]
MISTHFANLSTYFADAKSTVPVGLTHPSLMHPTREAEPFAICMPQSPLLTGRKPGACVVGRSEFDEFGQMTSTRRDSGTKLSNKQALAGEERPETEAEADDEGYSLPPGDPFELDVREGSESDCLLDETEQQSPTRSFCSNEASSSQGESESARGKRDWPTRRGG